MEDGAAILVIGNEILSGKVRDSNSPFLIEELRELGFPVLRVCVLPDVVEEIATTVRALSERYRVVFTSGGVGPTLDDVTMDGLAHAFGMPIVENTDLARVIRDHFGERTTASHLRMARIPEDAVVTWSGERAWPVVEVRNVVVLPGDPTILQKKFASIRERFRRSPYHLKRLFTRLDEGELAPLLDHLDATHPEVSIGSYPVYDGRGYDVQVTLESKSVEVVVRALADLEAAIPKEAIVRIE